MIRAALVSVFLLCGSLAAAGPGDSLDDLLREGQQQLDEGRIEQALLTFRRVYDAAQGGHAEAARLTAINSLANLYYETGQLDSALRFYRELEVLDEARGDDTALAVTLFNLGHVYASRNDFAASDAAFSRSLSLSQELGDLAGEAYVLKALGVSAHAQGQYGVAEQYLVEAVRLFGQLNDEQQAAVAYRNLGDVAQADGRPADAITFYQKSLPFLQSYQQRKPLLRLYRGMADALAATGDYEQAFAAHQVYSVLMQEDLQQQGEDALQRLQVQFETERFADENTRLELANTLQAQELRNRQQRLQWQYLALSLAALAIVLVAALWRRSRRYAAQMRELATIDPLTKLLNRRAVYDKGATEWRRAVRYERPLTVLLFDIDHFKSINDGFGHAVGDDVLKVVADVSRAAIRKTDVLGRIGGEEFLVVCPESTAEQAAVVAERIRIAIERSTFSAMPQRTVTTSVGAAQLVDEESLEALIHRADQALYRAKAAGRNRLVLATRDEFDDS